MTARVALSSNGRSAQYVGTTRASPPSPVLGSPTSRKFNGTSDRMVGPRSLDLGANYALVMTMWRSEAAPTLDSQTAQRLFTQYCAAGTRVGVGINRSFYALTYTLANGVTQTVESRIQATDVLRHNLAVIVTASQIRVLLEGLEIIKVDATLMAPNEALCNFGSDSAGRFFKGFIDDLAMYKTLPGDTANWLRYYSALVRRSNPRDYVPAVLSAGYNSATIISDGYAVQGSSLSPTSRAKLGTAFRSETQLSPQTVEVTFSQGDGGFMIGVMNVAHALETDDIGSTPNSYAFSTDGTLIHDGEAIVTGMTLWGPNNVMALRWNPSTAQISLWRDGVQLHSQNIGAGPWTFAVSAGTRLVQIKTGQALWQSFGLDTQGVYSQAWSRLATEFRKMKVGEVAALLDDPDLVLRDANTGLGRGTYLDPAAPVAAGITPDSLDVSRGVGAGIQIPAAAWTQADLDFFFAVAFQPTAADLVGEKVLLQSGTAWSLTLLDGNIFAQVGDAVVGSTGVAFEEGKSYFLGLLRGTTGKVMVWSPHGFLLQSADATVSQAAADVWVGGASDGSKQIAGQLSHLVLSSTRPAAWKLDRLAKAEVWDKPTIEGLEPTIPTIREAFEPSWRDVVANLGITNPAADACYYGFVCAQPDELTLDYRLVARTGSDPFYGERISGFAPYAKLNTIMPASEGPILVTFTDANDLDRVSVGAVAMVGQELCRVSLINIPAYSMVLERGCVDTVPAAHVVGTEVWFMEGYLGSDLVPYADAATVDGKALARTALGETAEELTPTDSLLMTGRLARPYPPGALRVNDQASPAPVAGIFEVRWRTRNKVTQGADLLPYSSDSVDAPIGVTYVVRLYDDVGTLLAESIALPYNTVAYDMAAEYDGSVRVTVTSYEAGVACWQTPEVAFEYTGNVVVVLMTEEGEPLVGEADEALLLEGDSASTYSSFSGRPAGSYRTEEEEEEEEMGVSPFAVDGVIGVRISELPKNLSPLAGDEIFPIVRDGQNYHETMADLFSYIESTLPPPVNGKSAYEIWLDQGNTGTEEDFLDSLTGAQGLPSNVSRRIQTVNSANGAVVCNWALYDEIRLRLVGDVSLVFQSAVDSQGCLLKVVQDSVGGHTCTLPPNVRYNLLLPAYAATAGAGVADKVGFIYDSGDSKYDLVSLVPGIQ